jgi:hypothetical protein
VRNDAAEPASYSPFTLVGWYQQAGRRKHSMSGGQGGTLAHGESFTLPLGPLLGAAPDDRLDKLRAEFGTGRQREVFVVQ